ncbi:N-fatty-acyl-amino acid synthase/hydrolase PM20D1.2-like isoform X1 [Mytilus galloprovincialis]|uniref:N-fatty-acyl-amino acid synthase/hydrolase PM20D1.2-like isoform X1 n=2 Tax=Mytilus galloprovincialis TaxID=29158 RepID=UPI003F7C29B6
MSCKQICITLAAVCSVLLVIVLVRTFTLVPRKDAVIACKTADSDFIKLTDQIVKRFQRALQIKTISFKRGEYNRDQLLLLSSHLEKSFPLVHLSPLVKLDIIANYSRLYTITGSNTSLTPYLLAAHLDVVPAIPEEWEFPPFEAQIKDEYIYARGAIDFKQGIMGILEALEYLLSKGFKPNRSFYIAFGHDEEVTGVDGAKAVGQELQARGLKKLEFLLDEGLTVLNGFLPGIQKPVALIGIGEKGFLTLKLHVKGEAGHSSMPLKETAIGILAKAVVKIEDNPLPSMLGYGPEKEMLEHLAHEMPLAARIIMSNLWLFGPLVSWFFSQKPATNAIIRTVTSVTMFNGGVKTNVLPSDATAYINHRIHPAQSLQEIIDYDKAIINDDRVKLSVEDSMVAASGSPSGENDFGYQIISNSIRQIWTNATTAPGMMIGNTDTKHYKDFTNNIYRFSPTVMFPGDEKRFHGVNERISKQNFEQAINFYYHIIVNSDRNTLSISHKHSDEL